ncbi:MAG: hypothetical protein Q7K57_48425, partial [Burkholderiaceae bacterium]|nr:hypothetical protein [Burkholderiaceae bacterium]
KAAVAGLLAPAKVLSVDVTDAPPIPLAFMPAPCEKYPSVAMAEVTGAPIAANTAKWQIDFINFVICLFVMLKILSRSIHHPGIRLHFVSHTFDVEHEEPIRTRL